MVRLACFTSFASKVKRYVIVDQNPSLFCLQTHRLLSTHTIVSLKQDHSDSTVNYLINSCGLSPQGAILASKWVNLQSQEKADSVLVSFRNHGFSESQISQVVRRRPHILCCKFDKTIRPKLQYFTSYGISAEDLAKIVASNPDLLGRSLVNNIIPTHTLLKSMLPHDSVVTVLRRTSRIFNVNHDTCLLPNISLLKQLGVPQSCVSMSLVHFTGLMILKHESFAKLVCEAKEMGFDMKNTTSLWAMKALRCKNTLNRNRQACMMRWGWSEGDFLSAFRRCPRSILVSEKKLSQVMDTWVKKMGLPSPMIAKHPEIFAFSLEKRILPRGLVFKVLLSKGLINEDLSLLSVLTYAEGEFLDVFVTKYVNQIPQLLSVYQGTVDINDVIS